MVGMGVTLPDWHKLPRWRQIEFPIHTDERGSLTVADTGDPFQIGYAEDELPWKPARVYWLSNLQDGESRGAHATFESESIIIPVAGHFDIHLKDGVHGETIRLRAPSRNEPAIGVHLHSGVWRDLDSFRMGTVVLCMSSTAYSDTDYVRDYGEWERRVEVEKRQWLYSRGLTDFPPLVNE